MSAPKKTKDILFLTHVGEPGGAEFVMMRLAESVKERCRVVHFAPGPLSQDLEKRGIDHSVLHAPESILGVRRQGALLSAVKSIPGIMGMIRQLAKECRQYKTVICMSQKSALLCAFAKPFMRKPVIWFMNDLVSKDSFSKVLILLMTKVLARMAGTIVVNSEASNDAWKNVGGPMDKTVVIYPGTDNDHIDALRSQKETVAAYRQQFSPDNKPLIGIFGRISDWKGQDVFLKALAQVPNACGLIVGGVFFEQKQFRDSLDKIIEEHNLQDHITFAGHLHDVPCAMAACDIIVHASTQPEPFGLVIVEAMMCEKPVIISDAGGAREIVVEGETGLRTTPKDADALAKAIQYYLDNPDTARTMAQKGRTRAVKKFSNAAMIVDFKRLLEQTS